MLDPQRRELAVVKRAVESLGLVYKDDAGIRTIIETHDGKRVTPHDSYDIPMYLLPIIDTVEALGKVFKFRAPYGFGDPNHSDWWDNPWYGLSSPEELAVKLAVMTGEKSREEEI